MFRVDWFSRDPSYVDPLTRQGEEVLRRFLTPQQWEAYEKTRSIPVVGSKGGSYTVVCHGLVGNILRHNSDGSRERFCVHPLSRWIRGPDGHDRKNPTPVDYASQVTALEDDETGVMELANPWN